MLLSDEKKDILSVLLETGKPLKARYVASKLNLSLPSSIMHLLGLRKMGLVFCPEKSYYSISPSGKEVLSLSKATKDEALSILRVLPPEKAFLFYMDVDWFTGISAKSLEDFCSKIECVNPKSIHFHVMRGDFERWFRYIGDSELAKWLGGLRESPVKDMETLKEKLTATVKARYEQLYQKSTR